MIGWILPSVLVLSALVALCLAVLGWHFRRSPGALPFVITAALCVGWTLVSAVDVVTVTLPEKIWTNRIRLLFVTPIPMFWLVMSFEHTMGRLWLTPRRLFWVMLVPLMAMGLVVTEDHHTWYRYGFSLDDSTSPPGLLFTRGVGVKANLLLSYALMTAAIFLLLRAARGATAFFRSQNLCIAVALALPVGVDALALLDLWPIRGMSLAASLTAFTNSLLLWSLLRYRVLDLAPVARGTLIDTMADLMLVFDAHGRMVDLNRAAATTLALDAKALIGKDAELVLAAAPDLRDALRGGKGSSEVQIGPRYYDVFVGPIEDRSRAEVGRLVVLRDISERRRMEESLRVAKEAAEAATEAKSAFLAMMSHEIRTPLNGVIGTLELLLATTATQPEQRAHLRTALDRSEALLGIINGILDLSRLEAGHLELEAVAFNLERLVNEVFALFAEDMRRKGLAHGCVIAEDVSPFVRGDPARLRQILVNLVDNAVKFTAHGEVRLEVDRVDSSTDGGRVRFRVIDTGIGFDEDKKPALFQPFVQAEVGHARRFGGTGLGLAISRLLCHQMGGEIDVESREGRGSCFWCTVRLEPCSAEDVCNGADEAPVIPRSPVPHAILVAEDDPTSRATVMTVLEKAGFRPRGVSNGAEVLEAIEQGDFDLVLMDCQMPGVDGYEATRRLRSRDPEARNRDVPIVAVTAAALGEERARCLAAGMVDYLPKPFKMADLLAVVHRWLPEARGVGEPTPEPPTRDDAWAQATLEAALLGMTEELRLGVREARSILEEFFPRFHGQRDEIDRLLEARDAGRAGRALHQFKSALGCLRLRSLHRQAGDCERAVQEEDWASAQRSLDRLTSEIATLAAEIGASRPA